MRKYLKDKSTLKSCRIYQMLNTHAKRKHFSLHTPGHKVGKWDITELSFSDNLSAPNGCILQAEQELSALLHADQSFILTDGSTSGVLSMLYSAKRLGVQKIIAPLESHKSFFNACALFGITPFLFPTERKQGIPTALCFSDLYARFQEPFDQADAVFLTSPDYYGNVADLQAFQAFCKEHDKLLLIDGAHGGHLRFHKQHHASTFADFWVDGVHKSLPAFTQGAVVSAKTHGELLRTAVNLFRTSSPSYPIMASVEYAVKYPQNVALEKAVALWKENFKNRVYQNIDWTKLCVLFGEKAFEVDKWLQSRGIYSEFCDGNAIVFYLSPALTLRQFNTLTKILERIFSNFPFMENDGGRYALSEIKTQNDPTMYALNETEWIELNHAEGRICASVCGLFPPCTPLLLVGEKISEEKLDLLKKADNAFGLVERKICVYKNA